MGKVIILKTENGNMTVEEALNVAKNEDLQDILIIGYDQDNELFAASSKMDMGEAITMASMFNHITLNKLIEGNDDD